MSLTQIKWLKIKDCAAKFGVSVPRIYQLVRLGRLTKAGTIIIIDDKFLKTEESYKANKEMKQ
jgi:hypothetical protein